MTIVPAEIVEFEREEALRLGSMTTPAWPAAFTRLKADADTFLEKFPCNHIHGVYGEWTEELILTAKLMNMEVQVLTSSSKCGRHK